MITVDIGSFSDRAPRTYRVQGVDINTLGCSCPAYRYYPGPCKHIRAIWEAAELGLQLVLGPAVRNEAAPERLVHPDLLADGDPECDVLWEIPF